MKNKKLKFFKRSNFIKKIVKNLSFEDKTEEKIEYPEILKFLKKKFLN